MNRADRKVTTKSIYVAPKNGPCLLCVADQSLRFQSDRQPHQSQHGLSVDPSVPLFHVLLSTGKGNNSNNKLLHFAV
jgi:hypothetical protein